MNAQWVAVGFGLSPLMGAVAVMATISILDRWEERQRRRRRAASQPPTPEEQAALAEVMAHLGHKPPPTRAEAEAAWRAWADRKNADLSEMLFRYQTETVHGARVAIPNQENWVHLGEWRDEELIPPRS